MAFEAGENTGRRRRSWYRRRLRIQRGLIAFAIVLVLAGMGWQGVTRIFAYRSRQASRAGSDTWKHGDIHAKLTSLAVSKSKPARMIPDAAANVYPYSVIPGGVRDADDLQRATHHDRLVWQHYARFQYEHARLVRATEARAVYLSYRLRNHIYWTRKRMRLHPGELLLTDGKITARTRCGNQVSEEPQPEVSEEEPSEDVLDRPVRPDAAPALPIRSALTSPALPGVEPVAPQGPQLFGGGFIFPYVPFGVPLTQVCETPAQEASENSHGISDDESIERRCKPKHKPPVVPEPSTMLLLSSGLAVVYWQYRRTSQARAL